MTCPDASEAEEADRPTIQNRFAAKDSSAYAHVTGLTHIRNDYYDSFGFGIDGGYYFSETFGAELRWAILETSLSDTARDIKERTGLTPDAQPQSMLLTGGGRFSFGYGKILLFDSFVVHFDPQLVAHGGVAFAETRVLPTGLFAVSLLTHYQWGLQAKFDLAFSVQGESRDRGFVTTFGFMPTLGIGWNFDTGGGE